MLIPIILFGGYLRPYGNVESPPLARTLSQLTPTRWSYEALVQAEQIERKDARDWEIKKDENNDFIPFDKREKGITREDRPARIYWCLTALSIGTTLLGAWAWYLLRKLR